MTKPKPSPISSNSEEGRAFLQYRVALFWKVEFFITLLGSGLGVIGAIVHPGVEVLFTLSETALAGLLWWLCSRGARTIRFSHVADGGGLLITAIIGAFVGRFLLGAFSRDHSVVSSEGALMADGYMSMIKLGGTATVVAIRAALIPSAPRRTIMVTAPVGAPLIIVSSALVPAADGGLTWRALDWGDYFWLSANATAMWVFTVITCTVISWIIYGLRKEVREARRFGQYMLEQKLGEGGMGEVYRARHGMMRRPSAIKLLRGDSTSERNLQRFEREVQLTARLTHPNTITIFDFGRTEDGVFYYAMELLNGATLQRIVEVDGAQAPGRVVRILAMACGALAEAHAIGLVHRDIKPANIMLCTQGGECDVVKVLDFGLVKELEVDRDIQLTGVNALIGTPQYMAPESILNPDSVDVRADIYALGAVAYYLLSGVDVFTGKSVVEVCAQHLHNKPESLSARGVAIPAELEALVLACLEKDPDGRPQSAAELKRRIEACPVEPWDSDVAGAWWRDRRADLDGDAVKIRSATRTIAIDAMHRPLMEAAG